MSPKRLAQQECANYEGGVCAGVMINSDLSNVIDPELRGEPCLVSKTRCEYFEKCILPLEKNVKHRNDGNQILKAIKSYKLNIMGIDTARRCRDCSKEVTGLKANERYCPSCKVKRKQSTWRKSKRRSRCPQSRSGSQTI